MTEIERDGGWAGGARVVGGVGGHVGALHL